jgi:hypothetical protein
MLQGYGASHVGGLDHTKLTSNVEKTYLLLQETLDLRRLASPEQAKIAARLQRLYPDSESEAKCKGCADDY